MASGLRQSEEWARFLASQGWLVEEIDGTKAYIRRLPFYGSVIKIQRPKAIPPVEEIDKIAKRHHAFFVKLEPLTINHKPLAGFVPDKSPNLPTKTIIIDLTKSREELWRGLSQDARQSIRKAEGASFGFAESSALRRIRSESNQLLVISYRHGEGKFDEALKSFHQILRETGRRQNFWTSSFDQLMIKAESFGKDAALFLAYHPSSDQPIAGALNLIHDGISYGHLAASSSEGRRLHAPYFLMWEMIKFFKNPKPRMLNPIRYFDLEGIYDPRYHKFTKSWQGFTLFKRKFGGKEVTYPQPLIKYYHPAAKLLFELASLSN